MSETKSPRTPAGGGAASESGEASSKALRRGNESLSSELGSTTIADAVVTKIVSIAAREVGGVHDLGGGAARTIGGVTQRVGVGPDERMRGVAVEVNGNPHRLDLKTEHVRQAVERGTRLVVSADSHGLDELTHVRYAVGTARRD